jgi:hypothetical protein
MRRALSHLKLEILHIIRSSAPRSTERRRLVPGVRPQPDLAIIEHERRLFAQPKLPAKVAIIGLDILEQVKADRKVLVPRARQYTHGIAWHGIGDEACSVALFIDQAVSIDTCMTGL